MSEDLEELAAYADWPVSVKVGGFWCERGARCLNPRCGGNGATEIRAGISLTPRELMAWIRKHAEEGE